MHAVLTQVVPAIALAVVPFLFTNPARARPINNNYEFADDDTTAAKYDQNLGLATLHEQKRDLAVPLVDRGVTIATSQAKRDEEPEIVEHGDAPIFVTLEKRSGVSDGSASNVQLRPTKRWGQGSWDGPECCGNPCYGCGSYKW